MQSSQTAAEKGQQMFMVQLAAQKLSPHGPM
jgi:hypothetical protein